jgi:hypothetical protein
MWKPRRFTTLWASTACYRDSLARKGTLTLVLASPALSDWGKSRLRAQDIHGRSIRATEVRRGLLQCECNGQQAIVCYGREYKRRWGLLQCERTLRLTTSPPSVSDCLENVGFSTSHNPIGLYGLLQGYTHWRRMGLGGIAPLFLNWALSENEWSVSRLSRFNFPLDWVLGWGQNCREGTNLSPLRDSNHGQSTRRYLYTTVEWLMTFRKV